MNEWVSLLQTFGLAVAILFFLGLCLWKAAGWIAPNVITPIVARYLQLIDALIASVVRQGDAIARFVDVLDKLGATLERMGKHWEDLYPRSK